MQIIITGANRGIGNALFTQYQNRGDQVIGTARRGSGYVSLDVSQPDDFKNLTAAVGDAAVDLLICNAGVYLDKGATLETGYAPHIWADSFAVNVTGVFLSVQSLLPNLRRAQNPKIAIISSQMASHTRAPGGSYVYRASKAAALNLGRNLATDLRSDGIAVGIYHPGWVNTDMGGDAAPTTVDQSAMGLMAEFDQLRLKTTGCFRTYDGVDHAY